MIEPFWDIEYSLEARNYLYDSHPYTEAVLIAIEELRFYKDAIPPDGCTQLEPGVYLCELMRHLVVYRRFPEAKPKPLLWISMVKPPD